MNPQMRSAIFVIRVFCKRDICICRLFGLPLHPWTKIQIRVNPTSLTTSSFRITPFTADVICTNPLGHKRRHCHSCTTSVEQQVRIGNIENLLTLFCKQKVISSHKDNQILLSSTSAIVNFVQSISKMPSAASASTSVFASLPAGSPIEVRLHKWI